MQIYHLHRKSGKLLLLHAMSWCLFYNNDIKQIMCIFNKNYAERNFSFF